MITLSGGTGSATKALESYNTAWKAFLIIHHLEMLERLAQSLTFSWKVANKEVLYANLIAIGEEAEQIHIGTVDNRFIASVALHKDYLGMPIIKILERRPNANDPLGLDSLDYLVKDEAEIFRMLKETGAHVVREHNEVHDWISLRFGKNLEFEAKFVDHLVLEVAIEELDLANTKILKQIYTTNK